MTQGIIQSIRDSVAVFRPLTVEEMEGIVIRNAERRGRRSVPIAPSLWNALRSEGLIDEKGDFTHEGMMAYAEAMVRLHFPEYCHNPIDFKDENDSR